MVTAGTGWNARSQLFSDQSQGKLGVVLPQDGSAFQINTMSLVANAPNPRAAQAFINYAISAEAQKAFTERMSYGPVNRTAQIAPAALNRTAASPENMARMVPIDWAYVATVRDRWNDRWRREVFASVATRPSSACGRRMRRPYGGRRVRSTASANRSCSASESGA